ncbi:hypothetical protein H6G00_01950 [Leptolyngbya sp. FACHB-541]|uniref:hypothetical protein n=1 Tax=Leptolyngbya sp. FACHB-541 TaxID=2692810 RepID=UPI001689D9CC|nr:hypothetical protein [Leptolyngbya sp. FACHB-541]MBD1995395.1 hypothetical protein [Leptolyngbya sp. FACHB-541]
MAKNVEITCDRCHRPIPTLDTRVSDFLKQEFPGQDICSNCADEIDLAAQVQRHATLQRRSPSEVLSDWLKLYEEQ